MVAYVLLVLVGALCLVPFVWLIRSSFMTASQIFEVPPQWIPDPSKFANYAGAMSEQPFVRYFSNTAQIVPPGGARDASLSCSAAAFAFSRLLWPGRNLVFGHLDVGPDAAPTR